MKRLFSQLTLILTLSLGYSLSIAVANPLHLIKVENLIIEDQQESVTMFAADSLSETIKDTL